MRKLFSLLAAVLFAGSMMADVVTFTKDDFAGQGTANTGSEVTATKGGVTFTFTKGYCADESLRCYAHGALTITATSNIQKINFTTTGGKTGGLDAEVTVNATSYVVADLASQARFTEIAVTLGEGGDPVTPPAGDKIDLDVDYCDAMYITDEEGSYWQFVLYKGVDDEENLVYPALYIGVEPISSTAIAGTYVATDIYYVSLEPDAETEIEGGGFTNLVVTYIGGDTYHFSIEFKDVDEQVYVLDKDAEVVAYDYETGDDIELIEGGGTPVVPGGDEIVFTGDDFTGQGTANTGSEVSATKSGVTFACDKGYNDDAHSTLRCYKNGVITITSEKQISKLEFQFYSTYTGGLDTEVAVNAKEWVYTLPSQARIEKLTVTLDGATAIDNTEATVKAVKTIENGMLIIEKNGVRYNVYGAQVR